MLAKPPEEITLGEIVAVMEGGLKLTVCTENPASCERAETCVTRTIWQAATEALYRKLNEFNLADLVGMMQASGENKALGCIHDGE